MMKNTIKLICFLLILIQAAPVCAQEGAPFWSEIKAFQKLDSLEPPPKAPIVFTGSSSFRMWTDVQKDFPKHTIVNRGFGGSTLPDVIRYEEETIFKYNPKQVVIYCGDNDLASSDTVTAKTVFARFKQLFTDIRTRLPKASVVYVSIKPSPSRWRLKEKMLEANALIKSFLGKKKNTAFADVWTPMLDGEGKPIADIFKEDKLHMKPEGYAIWAKVLEKYLK